MNSDEFMNNSIPGNSKQYLTVLAIDDDDQFLVFLENALKQALHSRCIILSATDAYHGIELAVQHVPDVILLDVVMRHLDGYSALLLLKDTPQTNRIPVIMMSAFRNKSTIIQLFQEGAAAFLIKPFTMKSLFVKILAAMNWEEDILKMHA